jgi:hypothetical protein
MERWLFAGASWDMLLAPGNAQVPSFSFFS